MDLSLSRSYSWFFSWRVFEVLFRMWFNTISGRSNMVFRWKRLQIKWYKIFRNLHTYCFPQALLQFFAKNLCNYINLHKNLFAKEVFIFRNYAENILNNHEFMYEKVMWVGISNILIAELHYTTQNIRTVNACLLRKRSSKKKKKKTSIQSVKLSNFVQIYKTFCIYSSKIWKPAI